MAAGDQSEGGATVMLQALGSRRSGTPDLRQDGAYMEVDTTNTGQIGTPFVSPESSDVMRPGSQVAFHQHRTLAPPAPTSS